MTDINEILSRLNAIIRGPESLDSVALLKVLQGSDPKHIIELPRSVSILHCALFDGDLIGSVAYDLGDTPLLLIIPDNGMFFANDAWPTVDGFAPAITRSPNSEAGCNVVYGDDRWRFGAGFNERDGEIYILFSKRLMD